MSQTTEKRSRLARFGRWVAELILVFIGVYGAKTQGMKILSVHLVVVA